MKDSHQIAPFLRCPAEVCNLILSNLFGKDLRNLCLVHQYLRTLAEPYVYSMIHFSWKAFQPHPITSLLRSILRRPELATYTRKLEFMGNSFSKHRFRSKAPKIPVSESELEEPLAFVAKTTVSYRSAWMDGLQEGTMDAFVAALLSQPLSLGHLYIYSDYFIESRFIGLVFRSMLFGPHDCGLRFDLRRLEIVHISAQYYKQACGRKRSRKIADVLTFFYLPCVKELGFAVGIPSTILWPVPNPPSISSLRDLYVENLRESSLTELLSTTNRLEYLQWCWDYDYKGDDQAHTSVIDLDQVSEALSYTRATLVRVDILEAYKPKKQRNVPLPRLRTKGHLNGMNKFEKLTMLCVPLPFLLGFNIDVAKRIEDYLPRTLEMMTIGDDFCPYDSSEWWDHELFTVLQRWRENVQTSTPRVHRVIIFVPRKCSLHNLDSIEFQKRWKEVGVDYEVFRTWRTKS